MAHLAVDPKQQAHELIDLMAPGEVAAALSVLEGMASPLARALANAPYDDEPVSDEDREAIKASRAGGNFVSHEEVLADFGLTMDDFEKMGATPTEVECDT